MIFPAVTSLDWNRTGSVLATGCFDGAVRLWTQTGHLRNTLEAQKGPISALRWNYNGDYLISSSVDKSVVAWDLRNTTASKAAIAQQFSVHNTSVVDISWVSYDSFISCSTDKTIKLCEIGMEGSRKTFLGHTDDINAVSYNHNCNRFASCSDDRTVKIWSVNESFPVADLTDHTLEIYSMRWNPQGTNIASASFDTTVKLWDVQRQNCLHTWENIGKPSQCVAFSPDGKYMCIGGSCRSLFIYDLRSYTLVKTFITENALTGFSEVCWNVSGEKLTGICSDGSIMLFDTRFLGLIR
ncbi:unnamed protein product [Caenorhabditis auriculariae]|uniref:Uncharacterized protein n=1 Tax=Caenorhabditis auriculariae TaxID=2777116 RepID=A0A8S1H465_9PELO|nr:unnamed protein product [Caenorhabditis auriculariae]